MAFDFGNVVLVPFPFTDQGGSKQRPAVVVSSATYAEARPDIVIVAITGRVRPTLGFAEYVVADWQDAGLIKPSVVKPVVATIEQTLVRRVLGMMTDLDKRGVSTVVRSILAVTGQ